MAILVTGGAGYIGSHTVVELQNAGYDVVVVDNLSNSSEKSLERVEKITGKRAAFYKADILDRKALNEIFEKEKIDSCIHFAGLKAVGESVAKPWEYYQNNITGTLNIMNAAVKHNCLKMIFSSSAATFGEPQYLPMDEKHPQHPINYYGFTKLEIEEFMGWYDQLKGMKFASLRYFNAAGYDVEGEITGLEQKPENLLPRVMEAALGQRTLKIFGTDYAASER